MIAESFPPEVLRTLLRQPYDENNPTAKQLYDLLNDYGPTYNSMPSKGSGIFSKDILGQGLWGQPLGIDRIEPFILCCQLCDHWELETKIKNSLLVEFGEQLRKGYLHAILDSVEDKLLDLYEDLLNVFTPSLPSFDIVDRILLTAFEAKQKNKISAKELDNVFQNIIRNILWFSLQYIPPRYASIPDPMLLFISLLSHYQNDSSFYKSKLTHPDKILVLIAILHYAKKYDLALRAVKAGLEEEEITDLYLACSDYPAYQTTVQEIFKETPVTNLNTLTWSSELQKDIDYAEKQKPRYAEQKQSLVSCLQRQEEEKAKQIVVTSSRSSSCSIS